MQFVKKFNNKIIIYRIKIFVKRTNELSKFEYFYFQNRVSLSSSRSNTKRIPISSNYPSSNFSLPNELNEFEYPFNMYNYRRDFVHDNYLSPLWPLLLLLLSTLPRVEKIEGLERLRKIARGEGK